MENNNIPQGFTEDVNAPAFEEGELGWDDEIEKDHEPLVIVPEGDYDFEIVKFERGRYEGSEKMPACNKATVYLKVVTPDGKEGLVRHQMFLHTKTEWQLTDFFTAIGYRKRGERLRMNWNIVVGSTGRAKIGIRKYNGNDYNEVKKFYDPDDSPQMKQAPQQTTFTPGAF